MEESRVQLLQDLQVWGDHHARPIFWLNGMAGTEKSTISRTIAKRFQEHGILGTSFFFSRSSGETNNARKFVGTLAYQLAHISAPLKNHICNANSHNGEVLRQGLRNQWKFLVVEPLLSLAPEQRLNLNFVIDALDECSSDDDVRLLLQLCVDLSNIKNVSVGVFITSRPEIAIHLGFKRMPEIIHHDLDLRDIPAETVKHDIFVFISHNLKTLGDEQDLAEWPRETDVQMLTEKSGCLFIYAATVCLFIADTSWDPTERLSEILQKEYLNVGPTALLDEMYLQILRAPLSKHRNEAEVAKLCDRFKEVIGPIVVLFDELSCSDLAHLLSLSQKTIDLCLNSLHSVLSVPKNPHNAIQLVHPSFRDFLLDEQRCGDRRFFRKETAIHEDLFMGCIEVMLSSLARNICLLQTPGSPPHSISQAALNKKLPRHLRYACQHWADHLNHLKSAFASKESLVIALGGLFIDKFLN